MTVVDERPRRCTNEYTPLSIYFLVQLSVNSEPASQHLPQHTGLLFYYFTVVLSTYLCRTLLVTLEVSP